MARLSMALLKKNLSPEQYAVLKKKISAPEKNPAEEWLKQAVSQAAKRFNLVFEDEYAPIPKRRFRLDAAIPDLKLGFECDGWQYHAKHKDSWLREKKRDRLFLRNGWHVYRFAASEIMSGEAMIEIEEIVSQVVCERSESTTG